MQMEGYPHLFYFHTDFEVDYEISIKPNDALLEMVPIRWIYTIYGIKCLLVMQNLGRPSWLLLKNFLIAITMYCYI